jgi:Family of unknown function (DUF6264)
MTDDRPIPQYGEYATPQQQAAAMGRDYVPAAPAEPAPPIPSTEPMPDAGHIVDRFVTVFQLGIGLVTLLSSDYFHLSENANTLLQELGNSNRMPASLDHYAWLLLGANILILLLTIVWAYATLRRGKRAFYIPFVGYCAFSVVFAIIILSVVR